ncbi:MAG: formate/nitrite transporter family protein [Ruminococcaceae bacterium]|nr:formate/nitrite transporter family protein [Oscillospiraceae bacterium]MBD5116529.1 formate/nitrite transporter family protein [Oscillospiraceae bacterium]
METLKKAIAAGFMIGIGAVIYISCDNKIVGSLMFTIGLFTICAFGMNLFTGKIGYAVSNKNNPNCLVIWLGNLIGASLGMALIRIAKPSLHDAAKEMMTAKLQQSYIGIPVLAFFCGVLMYIAVENYRSNPHGTGKVVGLFLCVSTFILSGFEHSIADMCYAALAVESVTDLWQYLLFLAAVSVFNGLGALAVRWITVQKEK